jgi:hypothetical protein
LLLRDRFWADVASYKTDVLDTAIQKIKLGKLETTVILDTTTTLLWTTPYWAVVSNI